MNKKSNQKRAVQQASNTAKHSKERYEQIPNMVDEETTNSKGKGNL